MAEIRRSIKYKGRTGRDRIAIAIIRVAVNILVTAILAGCGMSVYYVQQEATRQVIHYNYHFIFYFN